MQVLAHNTVQDFMVALFLYTKCVLLQKHNALIIENKDLIFSYCYSSACKYQIRIYLDCTVTMFNFKNLNSDLKLGQNFQQFLKFHYFINLPLHAMYLCKDAFSVLTIIKILINSENQWKCPEI